MKLLDSCVDQFEGDPKYVKFFAWIDGFLESRNPVHGTDLEGMMSFKSLGKNATCGHFCISCRSYHIRWWMEICATEGWLNDINWVSSCMKSKTRYHVEHLS